MLARLVACKRKFAMLADVAVSAVSLRGLVIELFLGWWIANEYDLSMKLYKSNKNEVPGKANSKPPRILEVRRFRVWKGGSRYKALMTATSSG